MIFGFDFQRDEVSFSFLLSHPTALSCIRWRTTQLELGAGDHGAPLLPDDRVLLEVKLPGVCPLWLAHALTEAGAVPVSFSKYGSCYCHHLLREQPVLLKEVFPCA